MTWKKNKNAQTLQEKLQEQEQKDNRVGNMIKLGAITLILLVCLGVVFPMLSDWLDIGGERTFATATAYAIADATATAVQMDRLGIKAGWEDPAEIMMTLVNPWTVTAVEY